MEPQDRAGRQQFVRGNGNPIATGLVPPVSGSHHTFALSVCPDSGKRRSSHSHGTEVPAGMDSETLDSGVRGKRPRDARETRGTVMDKFGRLIVTANFEMLVHINRGL